MNIVGFLSNFDLSKNGVNFNIKIFFRQTVSVSISMGLKVHEREAAYFKPHREQNFRYRDSMKKIFRMLIYRTIFFNSNLNFLLNLTIG